jgi:hypothetical protein
MSRFIFITILLFKANVIFATTDTLQALLSKMDKYRKVYPQEKIHLHFDKPFYSVGDTIYFKAYLVNAEKNKPSLISNLLHVDLFYNSKTLIKSITLPLEEGLGWGDFLLADTLHEGMYTIQAYTNWMRNFDTGFLFVKKIKVGDALSNNVVMKPTYKVENTADNKLKISADLHFVSLQGQPLVGKQVSYFIKTAAKEMDKVNSITDKGGFIHAVFYADGSMPERSKMEMVTTISLEEHKKVKKSVEIILPTSNSINFFPEGGNLVEGLQNRMGVKVLDDNGRGIGAIGVVVDKMGNEIAQFKTGFAGMGSFLFTPKKEEEYTAILKLSNGGQLKKMLPKAKAVGLVLSIGHVADSDKIVVKVNGSSTFEHSGFTILAQSNGTVQYQHQAILSYTGWSINLSKKRFPTGILQITLFDYLFQPVAERLVFVLHNDQMDIDVESFKKSYTKRDKVKLSFVTKDSSGSGMESSLSVSVVNEVTVPADELSEQTIYSDLLLSSDLKGCIEYPNYYFIGDVASKGMDLDNLLLTQGWRRFTWTDLLAQKYPPIIYPKEEGLKLSGRVFNAKGDGAAYAQVRLMSKNGAGFIIDTTADSNGFFVFNNLFYANDMPYVVQAKATSVSENSLVIEIENEEKPYLNEGIIAPVVGDDNGSMEVYLAGSSLRFEELRKQGLIINTKELENVTVNAKRVSKIEEAVKPSFNLNGPGDADQIVTYLDMKNCHTLQSCLQGRLTGVFFKANGAGRIFAYSTQAMAQGIRFGPDGNRIPNSENTARPPMLMVVDGVIKADFGVSDLSVQDIQSIEVLRGIKGAVYGLAGNNGVLVITTKQGGIDYNEDANASVNSSEALKDAYFGMAQGFYSSRQFYSPVYNATNITSTVPDLRSTILWRPNVFTDDEGEASIEFYNGDTIGKNRVVVEGISPTGKIGRKVFYYEVK